MGTDRWYHWGPRDPEHCSMPSMFPCEWREGYGEEGRSWWEEEGAM